MSKLLIIVIQLFSDDKNIEEEDLDESHYMEIYRERKIKRQLLAD